MRLLHIVVTLLLAAGLVSAAGSRCGNVDLIGYCEDQCGSGDGAVCTNNKPVCACDGSDGKAGEGQVDVPTPVVASSGGSRCGNVDLIGYCEDQCGSGDGAVCTNNKPVCACDGSDGKAGEGQVDVPTPVVASSGGSRCSATMALAAFMPAVAMVIAGLVNL